MKHLAPGLSVDADGTLRISVRELLTYHGYPHTPENEAQLVRAAQEILAEQYPGTEVVVTDRPVPA